MDYSFIIIVGVVGVIAVFLLVFFLCWIDNKVNGVIT